MGVHQRYSSGSLAAIRGAWGQDDSRVVASCTKNKMWRGGGECARGYRVHHAVAPGRGSIFEVVSRIANEQVLEMGRHVDFRSEIVSADRPSN
jgi:hypothetical protein